MVDTFAEDRVELQRVLGPPASVEAWPANRMISFGSDC
jgi:hypothetical protein